AAGSKPRPSSTTSRLTRSGHQARVSTHRSACACWSTLATSDCAARCTVSTTAGGGAYGSPSVRSVKRVVVPGCSVRSITPRSTCSSPSCGARAARSLQAAGVGEVRAGGVLDPGELGAGLGVGGAGGAAHQHDRVQALGEGVVEVLGEALPLLGHPLAPLGVGELGLGGAQAGHQAPVAL